MYMYGKSEGFPINTVDKSEIQHHLKCMKPYKIMGI